MPLYQAHFLVCPQGPGAHEERRGLVACVSADGAEQFDRTSTGELHFEFSKQRIVAKRPSRSVEPPGHDMLVDEVW